MSRVEYAREVLRAGRDLGVSPRGIVIGFATAFVESEWIMYANRKVPESLKLPYEKVGDDGYSVGLFQQQVRKGDNGQWWWADAATCMDPYKSARLFFERLKKLPYESGGRSPGWYAQEVQKSDFPDRYDQRIGDAQRLYDEIAGGAPVVDYGVTKVMHGYRTDTPANATGNSNGPRSRTDYVVIHTQEAKSTAVNLANFCNNNDVSYNFAIDGKDTIEIVPVGEGPWAAVDANNIGVHICIAGSFAGWSEKQWTDDVDDSGDGVSEVAALERAAKATAAACKQYGIPVVKVRSNGWPTDPKGIAGHVDFGARGGGHTDPGKWFPWEWFLGRVQFYLNGSEGGFMAALTDAQQKEMYDKVIWLFDQATGPGGGFKGWSQTGNRTTTDTVAAIAEKVGVPGCFDTKAGA